MTWYRTGTVSLGNGSTAVTGSGTAFVANAQIGEGFVAPDGRIYEITNIASDTSLTISPAYLGSTAGGQAYAIAPLRGRDPQIVTGINNLLDSFADVRDGIGAGLFPDGTLSLPALRFAADQDTGLARTGTNQVSVILGGQEAIRASAGTALLQGAVFTGLGLGAGTGLLELGNLRTADGGQIIDLTTQVGADFNTRINRSAGANGNLEISNTGTGVFAFSQNADSTFQYYINGPLRLQLTSAALHPSPDNAMSLGTGTFRWTTVFASTGTINTSDAREKTWAGAPNEAALRAANRIIGELGFFQWSDAIAEKGEDGARIHFGVRAQEVVRIMIEEGLESEQRLDFSPGTFIAPTDRPSFAHAFLCFDTWEDEFVPEMADVEVPIEEPSALIGEDGNPIMRVRMSKEPRPTGRVIQTVHAGNRFGLRIDQLTMFLLAALASRVAALEAAQ